MKFRFLLLALSVVTTTYAKEQQTQQLETQPEFHKKLHALMPYLSPRNKGCVQKLLDAAKRAGHSSPRDSEAINAFLESLNKLLNDNGFENLIVHLAKSEKLKKFVNVIIDTLIDGVTDDVAKFITSELKDSDANALYDLDVKAAITASNIPLLLILLTMYECKDFENIEKSDFPAQTKRLLETITALAKFIQKNIPKWLPRLFESGLNKALLEEILNNTEQVAKQMHPLISLEMKTAISCVRLIAKEYK